MMHQSKILLAAGLIAVSSTACFTDPTESLRGGPDRLELEQSALTLTGGDSGVVQVLVRDKQGNQLPVTNLSLTTADPAIATARAVSLIAPGDLFARGIINAAASAVGPTTVTVTANGLTATLRVLVLPDRFRGTVAITGTPGADTISISRPAPQPPLVVTYTAGDTLVLSATATVTFSATTSTVSFGPFPGYLISRSATQIKAVSRQPYAGPVTITNLTYAGTAETGPIAIASLNTDTLLTGGGPLRIQRGRFRGTTAVSGGIVLTVTPPAGMTFIDTGAAASRTAVWFGSTAATIITRTATQIEASATADYTGGIRLTRLLFGSVLMDSLATPANLTINRATFPGTIAITGGATPSLLDTVTADVGLSGATLNAATSVLTIGGKPTLLISRTASQIVAVPTIGAASGPITVTNVGVGSVLFPSLPSVSNYAFSNAEPDEPANQASAGARALAVTAACLAAAPCVYYAALDGSADTRDYFTFNLAVPAAVTVTMEFFGNGSGSSDDNPDLDVVICTALSATGSCSYGQDVLPGNAGSQLNQPETGTTPVIGPGQIWLRTFSYFATTGAPPRTYRLVISLQ